MTPACEIGLIIMSSISKSPWKVLDTLIKCKAISEQDILFQSRDSECLFHRCRHTGPSPGHSSVQDVAGPLRETRNWGKLQGKAGQECEWTADSQHWSTVVRSYRSCALHFSWQWAVPDWMRGKRGVYKVWSCVALTLFHPDVLTLSTALTGLCLFSQPLIMSKFSELRCFELMKQWLLQLSVSQFVRRGIENNPASTVWLVQLEEHSVTLWKQVLLQNWVFCPVLVFV